MKKILIRPHALHRIMTEPKVKTEVLSVGAKTYIKDLAKQYYFGYEARFSSKETNKGIEVEDAAIELYNDVFFTSHQKNTVRTNNAWLSGECDILAPDRVIDIKSSWSLATFPATKEDADSKEYEWQGRGYMMLYDRPLHEVAFCLVTTPEHLIGYEDGTLHYVDHLPPESRIVTVQYQRDSELEERIKQKCDAANEYYLTALENIRAARVH